MKTLCETDTALLWMIVFEKMWKLKCIVWGKKDNFFNVADILIQKGYFTLAKHNSNLFFFFFLPAAQM